MSTWKERQERRAAEAKLSPGKWVSVENAICFDDKGDGIVLFSRNVQRTPRADADFVALARNTYVELLNESDERDRLVVARAKAVERECPGCYFARVTRFELTKCQMCRGKGRVLIMPILDAEDTQ